MTPLIRYWPHLLIAALLFGAGYHFGALSGAVRAAEAEKALANAQRDMAQQETLAETQARAKERRDVERLAEIEEQHEEERREIEAASNRTIADLESGAIKLRQHWQGCEATSRVSGAAAGSVIADGGHQIRRESASRIIAAADEADAHVRALQRVIQSDRER